MTPLAPARALFALAAAALSLGLSGCAEPPRATAAANEVLPFEQAAAQAADGLVQQVQQTSGTLGRPARRAVVLDPMIDASTGQQTAATQLLQQRVAERMNAKGELFEILPFRVDNLGKAQLLLTGTMTRVPSDPSDPARRINLALTDLKSGQVAAQATALARDRGLDHTPLPYYRDSPVLLKDQVIDGYVRTTATKPGGSADKYYLERVAVAPVIDEATTSYNTEHYQEALSGYRSALSMPSGEQIRVLNGLYLSETKLGHTVEAEQAFGRVVAFGIQYAELGVKFLFNPGTTDFWADPRISGVYPMWLRQIAREAQSAKVCMNVVGHTSRTGSEQVNDTLSLKRANMIRQRLGAEQAQLTGRLQASGMGFRENIVGSGSDNAVDALDRRVEFKIVPCA